MRWTLPVIVLFSALFLLPSCEKEEANIAVINLKDPTPEQEVKIGGRLKDQILRDTNNFPVFYGVNLEAKRKLEQYLSRLVKTIAITEPVTNRNVYDWSITVIDSPDKNIFTSPGGHFFIYTGLLQSLENEAELVSLMAHELKYMNDGKATKSLGAEFGAVKLGDLVLDERVAQIDNMTLWLRDMAYSEQEVIEADSFAIKVLCPFDYDNTSLFTAVERLDSLNKLEYHDIAWINKRTRSNETIATLEQFEMSCGYNEHYYVERYLEMLETIE